MDWFFVSRLRVVSARLSRLVVVSLEVTVLSLTSLSRGSGWIRPHVDGCALCELCVCLRFLLFFGLGVYSLCSFDMMSHYG